MKLSTKIFIEADHNYVFGPGRLALLKAIRDLGSLRKAAQHFGMSYRWAWGRLDEAEKEMGVTLLARTDDVVRGRPKQLTQEAFELIAWADETKSRVDSVLREMEEKMPDFLQKNGQGKGQSAPPKESGTSGQSSKKNFTLD